MPQRPPAPNPPAPIEGERGAAAVRWIVGLGIFASLTITLVWMWPDPSNDIRPEPQGIEQSCLVGGGIPVRFDSGELRGMACLYLENK